MSASADAHLDASARVIAAAFLEGAWEPVAMADRAGRALRDRRRRWLRELAAITVRSFPDAPVHAPHRLLRVVRATALLTEHWWQDRRDGRPLRDLEPRALPAATSMGPTPWPVPPLATTGDLARELGLHPVHLDWYADVRSLERSASAEALRHYSYRWVPTRAHGSRLLEAPKPMLRFFQRRILHDVLDAVPPHDAAHGFRRGRSVHTFVAPHTGRPVVARLDLEGFFTSVSAGRIFATLNGLGYPEPVAHVLTGLTTNAAPPAVLRASPHPPVHRIDRHRRTLGLLRHPHLPQGAPTSPALANLVARRLDTRLAGLAASFDVAYTRYADDLAFSGGRHLCRPSSSDFLGLVADIIREEGFRVNPTKTRVAQRHERQALAGLVVNERPNVDRREVDRLRAILHDAARHGPDAANRQDHPAFRAHLLGRIGWIGESNPGRGQKLMAAFDRIRW